MKSSLRILCGIFIAGVMFLTPLPSRADVPIVSYRTSYTGAGTVTGPIITLTGQNVCVVTTSGGSSGGTVTVKGSSVGSGTLTTLTQFGSSGAITTDSTNFGSLTGTVPALTNFTYVKTGTVTGTLTVVETCSPAGGLTAANISGVVPAANGGTGQSSYTVGDMLYASGATALSKLADVAVGQVLSSGGVGVAPAYSAAPTIQGTNFSIIPNSALLGAPTAANTVSTIMLRDGSGQVAATTFTGALAGNATTATTATNATNTAITDDTSTNATMYPTWVTTASSNQAQKVSSTKLTWNPSTGTLTTVLLNATSATGTSQFGVASTDTTISGGLALGCFSCQAGLARVNVDRTSTVNGVAASLLALGDGAATHIAISKSTGNIGMIGSVRGGNAVTCAAASGAPCAFTWTCTMSSGACTTTQLVPATSICVITPTVSPDLSATNVVSSWVTLSSTTLTIHVSDLLGTSTAAFSGNGHCL